MSGRNPDRELDKTYLSIDTAEERGLLHRDYIAHVLRWSHVAKFLGSGNRYKDAVILDVGCGKEVPLAKTLYSNRLIPLHYVGVDANKFDIPEMLVGKKFPISLWTKSDFCALESRDVGYEILPDDHHKGPDWINPNIVACFEVLEHVTPGHCRRMLQHMREVTSDDCHYFISTPCYNGSAAENHINEMTFGALGSLIEDLGFSVVEVYGTFASIRDYKDQLSGWTYYRKISESPGIASSYVSETMDIGPVFEVLSQYYDTNVLAVMFAPLFPAHARNCLWHLTKYDIARDTHRRRFSKLAEAPGPWSQHPDWRELDGPRQ